MHVEEPPHVFFVDDEPGVRTVVQKTLSRAGMLVDCFRCAEECLARLNADGCDLLITDVKMDGMDGIQLLVEAKKQFPRLPVLVVTGFADVPMAVKALKEGAADFIEKPLERDALLRTIKGLMVTRDSIAGLSLTKAESRILRLILEGKNNREIAETLHRSARTIEVHRSHLMRKMGANNVVELLRRAVDLGFVDWPTGPHESAAK